MTSKKKLTIAIVVALVVLVAGLGGVKAAQIGTMIKAGGAFKPPPESVTTAKVEASAWQPARTAAGTLVALRGVTLSAELPGTVREIGFDNGSFVGRGQLMVRMDTSTEEAQLASSQAEAALAKLNVDRARSLRAGEANSQAELDAAEARLKQADAAVATLTATIAKKTIRAPFDGRISIRQVELGQVLAPGTPIASLQSVDPVLAEFSLPQQALADVKLGQAAHVHTDAFPGQEWAGQVSTINSEVDPSTRNVRVRATFANKDGRLRPGMYVNVEILGQDKVPVVLVPATAVIYAPYGDSVFALEEKKDDAGKATLTARQKFVRLGERRGDLVAVSNGLAAGETIVSSGAFKLKPGMAVVVKNELAPDARLDAAPADK